MLPTFLNLLLLAVAASSTVLDRAELPVSSITGQESDGIPNALCLRQSYEVSITRNQTTFQSLPFTVESPFPAPDNQSQVTFLVNEFLKSPSDFQKTYVSPTQEIKNETFSISGILCEPLQLQDNASTIELLVHGVGFDSSYWNFGAGYNLSTDYSYVYAAAAAGKTTFRYDRLGTGQSEKPDNGYDVVQASTDAAILKEIVSMLRQGDIGAKETQYTKVVGIGHSYGSFQLHSLVDANPAAIDGLILTGFSANSSNSHTNLASADYTIATLTNQAVRFFALNNSAYLITGTDSSNQLNFQWYPGMSAQAAAVARATEQPVTQGVLFTLPALNPTEYSGPLQVVNGVEDFIECSSNCLLPVSPGPSPNPAIAPDNQLGNVQAMLYPRVTNFSTFAANETGHALVEHYSAPAQFEAMLNFLTSNGF